MKSIKVVHVVQGKVNVHRANGVNAVIDGIARNISDKVELVVIGKSKGVRPGDTIRRGNYTVTLFPNTRTALTFFKSLEDVSIVHLHSVWQWMNYVFASYLMKHRIRFAITLHSGLSPDRVRKSKYLLRKIYHYFLQKSILDKASFIQALTQEESTDIISWTLNRKIKVIPNGVEDLSRFSAKYPLSDNRIVLGYLGRFGTEKNIDSLLDSLELLPCSIRSRLTIELLGPRTEEYEQLKTKIADSSLEDIVSFLGPLYGDAKYKAMQKWNGYIHVAYSDVVSIAVMEAFSIGLPAIISRTCHVSYFYKSDAFIMVEPHPSSIANGIIKFVESKNDWSKMSSAARDLARSTFNWDLITVDLLTEYKTAIKQ
jgi:glycosyltransferase involved in cell wall biosynthesis